MPNHEGDCRCSCLVGHKAGCCCAVGVLSDDELALLEKDVANNEFDQMTARDITRLIAEARRRRFDNMRVLVATITGQDDEGRDLHQCQRGVLLCRAGGHGDNWHERFSDDEGDINFCPTCGKRLP